MTHQYSKPLREHMNERRFLKKNIRDYLTRVRIVEDSTALSLLYRAKNALKDVEKKERERSLVDVSRATSQAQIYRDVTASSEEENIN
jgi:DNA-binding MltR family transcriptional regulator